MFGFKAQRQFRSAMSLDDGSVHKNQTNKILAVTFPIISKTWSFQKLLAIQSNLPQLQQQQKNLYKYPVTFKISGKLVGCAKLEFRTFGLCTVKKCWFSSCWTKSAYLQSTKAKGVFTDTRHAAMRLPLQIILACVNAIYNN